MTNINTINTGGRLFLCVSMGTEAMAALYDLRWMLVLIVVLILADFWFGLSESLFRHEEFRFSRAGRRTCNKAVDYLMYLFVGTTLGQAIFEPLGWTDHVTTAAVGLGLGCLWEIDSIVGHVCALHGVENHISIKRLIIAILKRKSRDAGEAVEEVLDGQDKKQ